MVSVGVDAAQFDVVEVAEGELVTHSNTPQLRCVSKTFGEELQAEGVVGRGGIVWCPMEII